MNNAKKLLQASIMALTLGIFTTAANAADNADVEAAVQTRAAIVVENVADMDFGLLDVLIDTQEGKVILKTDGTVDVAGTNSTVVASGTPVAGSVTIGTDGVSDIDVTCDDTAVLQNVAGDATLNLSEVTIFSDTGAVLADTVCDPLTPITVSPTAADVVLDVGATIDLDTEVVVTGLQDYSTENGTGVPVNIQAAYQ